MCAMCYCQCHNVWVLTIYWCGNVIDKKFSTDKKKKVLSYVICFILNQCHLSVFFFQNAMQIVGFMEHETQSVLELVAAVLKLGNIEFKPESRVNGLDESKVKDKNGKDTE